MRLLLTALAALVLSAPAFAQAYTATPSPTWEANVGAQYAVLLSAKDDRVRATALGQIQQIAHQRPDVDLSDTHAPLLALYQSEASDALRMAAVATLHTLGDSAAMERLAELARYESAPAVKRVALAALRDHHDSLSARDAAALSYRLR